MKSRLFVAVLLGFAIQSYSQINLDKEMELGSTLLLRKGMSLVYEVQSEAETYDFVVTITDFSDGVSFDYEMTNSENTKGKINISREAISNARLQLNDFEGGDLKLVDQTTVWVSKLVFNELVSKGKTRVITEKGEGEIEISKAKPGHDYTIYNNLAHAKVSDLSYVYAESKDGSAKYWIQLNEYSPLILKMDLGWTIFLKELR